MSQASNLKSTSITNLDGTNGVITANTSGEGAPGLVRVVSDYVTAVSADTTASTYKLVRIPTNAKVKSLNIWSSIATAGSGDVNVAYSDSAFDGTQVVNQGTIPQISAANNKLFGAAQSLVGTGTKVDFTLKGTYLPANFNTPLWSVLGLTSDPGGFFDIQINITTAVTTGGVVACEVSFVE